MAVNEMKAIDRQRKRETGLVKLELWIKSDDKNIGLDAGLDQVQPGGVIL